MEVTFVERTENCRERPVSTLYFKSNRAERAERRRFGRKKNKSTHMRRMAFGRAHSTVAIASCSDYQQFFFYFFISFPFLQFYLWLRVVVSLVIAFRFLLLNIFRFMIVGFFCLQQFSIWEWNSRAAFRSNSWKYLRFFENSEGLIDIDGLILIRFAKCLLVDCRIKRN